MLAVVGVVGKTEEESSKEAGVQVGDEVVGRADDRNMLAGL